MAEKNTEAKKDVRALYDLMWGYRAARVLQVANQLDIFTILSENAMTSEQICQRCQSKAGPTQKLLIACTAMGLLETKADSYKNTELSDTYLVRGRRLYQGDIIAHSASVWQFFNKLPDLMKSEPEPVDIKPADHRNFIMGMRNIAVAGRAQMFIDSVDLTGRKKLFDVGGGPGTYSITACKRYPQLKAVVFDLPETILITKELIAEEKLQHRITVRPGDWQIDDFGENNDVVLLSNVLHGPDSNAKMKLKKAFHSMVPGGLLVIQEFLLNDNKPGPLIPALFNVMVGAFSRTQLLSIIEKAGFCEPDVVADCQQVGATWITANKP